MRWASTVPFLVLSGFFYVNACVVRSTCPLMTILSSTDSPESRESNKYIYDITKVFYCLKRALQTDCVISKNDQCSIFQLSGEFFSVPDTLKKGESYSYLQGLKHHQDAFSWLVKHFHNSGGHIHVWVYGGFLKNRLKPLKTAINH